MAREREKLDELSGDRTRENPDDKMKLKERGIDFLTEKSSEAGLQPKRAANFGSQELTLSYLCENSKLGFQEKDVLGHNLLNSFDKLSGRYKGKEIVVSEDQNGEENKVWVERDFLQLNENRGNSSKREAENAGTEEEVREKKPKVELLNLSLALPDVSLSLAGSNRVQNGDLPSQLRPSRSMQSLGPSYNNTTTTYSNDFTAASLSYSYSHQFSHNPSCSLTRNSTENYEYSGSHRRDCDQIWNCGEGTNGSVHSRFRPIGDGTVALANPGGGGGFGMGNRGGLNKDLCNNNSVYRTTSSDNLSFFPSELLARPKLDALSGDSRRRNLENVRETEEMGVVNMRKISTPERLVREIVSESIPVMAQIIQEVPDETIKSAKEYLNNLIDAPKRKDELVSLQRRLERRSDFTNETLSKCQKSQLEILVAIKMGLGSFLSSKTKLPTPELVDIFLLERCRNINCRRLLPVDDCDCKICSTKKGFCSECMCPVCLNFDCASNTCSWVGCDACSHWCHAACGLQRNLIKPGPCLKGGSGSTEMQFHCLGCDHDSEMFGFVKDVFMSCAKDWGLENLIKELDCVRKVFAGSEDRKGKELHVKVNEMITKLQNRMITPPEVCSSVFQFFNSSDGLLDMGSSSMPSTDVTDQAGYGREAPAHPVSISLSPKPSFYNMNSSSSVRQDSAPSFDHQHNNPKVSVMEDKIIEDEWSVKPAKKDGFDSLESLVRIKEAEARMFQSRADEARREIDSVRCMIRMKTEELEEEYAEKLGKLCLQETEERRRKKLEELKALDNSHCDYYKMKIRMQSEISGLLKRMEATKQQLV